MLSVDQNSDWVGWVQLVTSGALGAGLTLIVEALRHRWNRPVLNVSFLPKDEYFARTPVSYHESDGNVSVAYGKWVRLKVTNTGGSTARNCRAFITGIHFADARYPNEDRIENQDALPLTWSLREGETTIDLPRKINQFVDLCHTTEVEPYVLIPDCKITPYRLAHIWKESGRFTITVIVTADDAEPASIVARLSWGGHWQDLGVFEGARVLSPQRWPRLSGLHVQWWWRTTGVEVTMDTELEHQHQRLNEFREKAKVARAATELIDQIDKPLLTIAGWKVYADNQHFIGAIKVNDEGNEYEIRVGRLNKTIAGSLTPKRRPAQQSKIRRHMIEEVDWRAVCRQI